MSAVTTLALREIRDLPGPAGLPLLGNTLQLNPRKIHLTMEAWSRRYGPLFRASVIGRQVLVLSDPEAIGAVLRARPDTFARPAITAEVSAELGGNPGLFLAEGEVWRQQRRMVMHGFSPGAVKAYFPRLREVALRLGQRWDTAVEEQREIDLSDDMKRYAVDVVAGLAFGADINTLASGDSALQDHVDTVMAGIARRSLVPLPYWRWLRLPADYRLERSVAALRVAVDGFVARARGALAHEPALRAQPANVLQAMLVAADAPDSGVDDAAVAGNVSTMLLAGEETTSSALAWLVWLLVRHPAALARAQQEVLSRVPDVASMTPEQADALDYVEACALEAMRLKPPAPYIPLQALRETTVLGVRVPAGTLVWCVMRHASVDAASVPEAERFNPERWLAAANPARQLSQPFGAGARMCPGRYLSLMEMKVAMALLLSRFDLVDARPRSGAAPAEVMGFVMAPAPMSMTLRRRAAAMA